MRIILFLLTLWCLPVLAQQIAVPELRQQVTDITGTLSTSEQQSLTQQLQDITQKTRAQVAVLIVPSTGDDSIEQYATRVFDNWRLGDAKRNDGILIIVAWSDRTVRIQVGYGLEELLLVWRDGWLASRIESRTFLPKGVKAMATARNGVAKQSNVVSTPQLPLKPAIGKTKASTMAAKQITPNVLIYPLAEINVSIIAQTNKAHQPLKGKG